MVSAGLVSLSLLLFFFSLSLSLVDVIVLVVATFRASALLSSSMVNECQSLAHMQLPPKCRHPRSCVSPSHRRPLVLLALFSLDTWLLSFLVCLFFASRPTDQQTAAHAPVVDTILEHRLSARSTRRSRDIRPGHSASVTKVLAFDISEIRFHCLGWLL